MRALLTISFCLLAAAMAGCIGGDAGGATEKASGVAIDEDAGTVGGASVFNDIAGIEAAFGEGEDSSVPLSWEPLVWLSVPEVAGRFCDPSRALATNPDARLGDKDKRKRGASVAYEDFVFWTWDRIACYVAVTGEGATTAAGLKIGDPFERAVELYPDFDCGGHFQPDAKLAEFPIVPACAGTRGSEEAPISVWITGDPVSEIWIGGTEEWMRTPAELPDESD